VWPWTLGRAYVHFKADQWCLPDREHHPWDCTVVTDLLDLLIRLIRLKITIYLVDAKSWDSSWVSYQYIPDIQGWIVTRRYERKARLRKTTSSSSVVRTLKMTLTTRLCR
jgi:hypothetical protein